LLIDAASGALVTVTPEGAGMADKGLTSGSEVGVWPEVDTSVAHVAPAGRPPPPAGGSLAVFLRRPASGPARVALVTVNLAAVTFFLLSYSQHGVRFGPTGSTWTLLISPISWSHHWVWCVPAVLTLAALSRRYPARLPLVLAVCGLLVFGAAPQWWFPASAGRELRWAPWQQLVGSSYVLFAALVLFLSACAMLTPRASRAFPPGPSLAPARQVAGDAGLAPR
jgi:hypothetical protein